MAWRTPAGGAGAPAVKRIRKVFLWGLGFVAGYLLTSLIVGFSFMRGQVENEKQWLYYSLWYGCEGEVLRLFLNFEHPLILPLLIELLGGVAGGYALWRLDRGRPDTSAGCGGEPKP